jgi:hypothetical protein
MTLRQAPGDGAERRGSGRALVRVVDQDSGEVEPRPGRTAPVFGRTWAEPLILSGYQGLKARQAGIPAPAIPRLADAAVGVVELYEAWGKADLSARWRVKLGLADFPDDVFGR